MKRKIIQIDEEKCDGCGICVNACHEGAIELVDGVAKLTREDYCDGLGDCLPSCPRGAISFIEKDTMPYDAKAVEANMQKKAQQSTPCACPGSNAKTISHPFVSNNTNVVNNSFSQLTQWPVQIQLVPVNAPYFENANLLIAADCAAYAHASFNQTFMKNKITIIGCPKLDECDYSEKLYQILQYNNIKSLTIIRMEVPCCGGIEQAAKIALMQSGKMIPWRVITLSINGEIIDE